MKSPSFSSLLREAADPVWEQCLKHPFVTGIGDGTLPIEKFRYYMLQDYLYLTDYARVFALGAAKARTPELMRRFARSVDTILNDEMNIHRAYMRRLGITEEQLLAVRPALDNLSYTNYMLSVAHNGTSADIAAAILACSWSYAEIGQTLAKISGSVDHPFYGEWIRGYVGETYTSSNTELIALTDALAAEVSPAQRDCMTEIFVNCSRYELGFWDMAWETRA